MYSVNYLENQTGQMGLEIQKTVLKIANEQADKMKEETGIEASSSEEDMKEYLHEVIKEVEKVRKNTLGSLVSDLRSGLNTNVLP